MLGERLEGLPASPPAGNDDLRAVQHGLDLGEYDGLDFCRGYASDGDNAAGARFDGADRGVVPVEPAPRMKTHEAGGQYLSDLQGGTVRWL